MSRPALLAALLFATSAQAVVPGPRAILRQYAETQALDRVPPGDLTGDVFVPGRADSTAVKASIAFPDACRVRAGSTTISVTHGDVTSNGATSPALEAAVAFMCPLFALKNVSASNAEEALARIAASWGVDQAVSSLNLMKGRPCAVVGARPGETNKPQIWFDRATGRPVRVIGIHGNQLWDVQFESPASIATNRVAPRVTRVYQDGTLQLSLHLMAVEPKISGAAPPTEEPEEDTGE